MAHIEIDNVIEYQKFRRNPGPLLSRAAEGRPLLVLKGRMRLVVVDAAAYNDLVRRAGGSTPPGEDGTGADEGKEGEP